MVEKAQAATLPVRVTWNGFPEVIVHSSIYKLKSLPEYCAAKRGNDQAAAGIARAVVRPGKIDTVVDFVVPVIQVEGGHYNAIPVALGAVLAQSIGAKLWLDVCQINNLRIGGPLTIVTRVRRATRMARGLYRDEPSGPNSD